MVLRKLKALGYDGANNFQIDDPKKFRAVVLWMENQIIRLYPIEGRKELMDLESNKWDGAFVKYCEDAQCPFTDPVDSLEWLVGLAVRYHYFDDKEKYSKETSAALKGEQSSAPVVTQANPLDNLNFDSPEFKSEVNKLADLLKVTQHPNPRVTLEAISTLITSAMAESDTEIKEGTPFPIMETDSGFDFGDYVLNQAAKALRLLYVHDLRDLQTKINESIVAVQTITANPKTDTSLGKVGY